MLTPDLDKFKDLAKILEINDSKIVSENSNESGSITSESESSSSLNSQKFIEN